MSTRSPNRIAIDRTAQVLLGTGCGVALWVLTRFWDDPGLPSGLYLFLFVFSVSASGTALALTGPLPLGGALRGALALAVPVAGLAWLGGLRFARATDFLDDPALVAVLAVLALMPIPFLLAGLRASGEWRSYPALFEAAWAITVRFAAAWTFVAVFWGFAILSSILLNLVGLTALESFLGFDWVRFALTGAILGMGLAVAFELRGTISPFLIVRLLRLLVPPVLAVVAIFLLAVPFRGLSQLFGEFSAAGTLMATAIAAITLVSSALDRDDAQAVSTPGLVVATRALAILLPLIAGLAAFAIWIRVEQYGWTPVRLLAACVALFLLAYGLGYAAAALIGRGWMNRIRTVNTGMALAVIVVAAVWMTPALDAFRIASQSQVARYAEGKATARELPLWDMAHDWGRAGRDGLDQLAQLAADRPDNDLGQLVPAARQQTDRYLFRKAVAELQVPLEVAELAGLITVRPAGSQGLGGAALAGLPAHTRAEWLDGCRRSLPDGRPACVLVSGGFAPVPDARIQGIFLYLGGTGVRGEHVMVGADDAVQVRVVYDPVADTWPSLPDDVIARALDGDFTIGPSGGLALSIGGTVLVPGN